MELRDAIKILREELGITQLELSTALHVTAITVSRWELGKSRPNKAVASLLMGYAYTHNVKRSTTDMLRTAFAEQNAKANKNNFYAGMMAVEHSSLSECIDDAPFPVFVCDINSDMMLYANKTALRIIDCSKNDVTEYKCYESIMQKDSPCEFCHKAVLKDDVFTPCKANGVDGTGYIVYGKRIRWNGHDAHIRYVLKNPAGFDGDENDSILGKEA